MARRKPDRLTERIAREVGGFQPLPLTPEQTAIRREKTPRETESQRKERLLQDVNHIIPPEGGQIIEQVRDTIYQKFALLELEVFVYRLYEAGPRSQSSYAEIAARLAETYKDERINENLVLMVANAARKKLWDALDATQQDALIKQKQGVYKVPKRLQKFILGLETH